MQRECEGVLKERDGLRGERDHLLHQLQQAIAAASHNGAIAGGSGGAAQPSSDTAMVRRSSGAGNSEDASEVQRLRAMVSELQRHMSSERTDATSDSAAASGVSRAGSVMTASVRINRFFLISFVLLLLAVLGMQVAKA